MRGTSGAYIYTSNVDWQSVEHFPSLVLIAIVLANAFGCLVLSRDTTDRKYLTMLLPYVAMRCLARSRLFLPRFAIMHFLGQT